MSDSITTQQQKRRIQVRIQEQYGIVIPDATRDKLILDQLKRMLVILSE